MVTTTKAMVKVIALQDGFYAGNRRRAGTEFEMEVEIEGDDRAYKFPKWVDVAGDFARRTLAKKRKDAEAKMVAGAIAASGDGASGGASKRKAESFVEAVNRS